MGWINDDACRMYNTNSQIEFENLMLKSSLCDHSDAYILVKWTISISEQVGHNRNNNNKEVVFRNCTHWLHEQNKQYANR